MEATKRFALRFVLSALIVSVLCGAAWAAPNEGVFYVNTSAQLKTALEDATSYWGMSLKDIHTRGNLTFSDSANAVGYNNISIGGDTATYSDGGESIIMDPSTSASLLIRGGRVITIKSGAEIRIFNGTLKNNADINNLWDRAKDATLTINGRLLVENDADLSLGSFSYFIENMLTGNVTGTKGGLTIKHSGAIIIKEGSEFGIEYEGERIGDIIWDSNSNGIIIFEKDANVRVPQNLFYDGDINVTNGNVIGIDENPGGYSGHAFRAGTYSYDKAKRAFIRTSDSIDPGNVGLTPDQDGEDDNDRPDNPDVDPVDKNIPADECEIVGAEFDSDIRAFVANPKPSVPSGHTYKGSLAFGLTYTDATAPVTLTIPIPSGFGIVPGASNIVARISKKDGTGTSEFPITVNANGSATFTIMPVGVYFSDATIVLTVKGGGGGGTGGGGGGTGGGGGSSTGGGSSGGGGCSTGAGLLAIAALGAVSLLRKK